jgi:hypothetical protein
MTSKPAEQLRNSADDSDWIQALQEVEEITVGEAEAERDRHKSAAATIREKAKRKIKMLCAELGIDREVFDAMLADRAEDRKYEAAKAKRAAKMPDTKVEYFLDALGQYGWLEPVALHPDTEPLSVAERSTRERIEAIQKITDQEQQEGADALNQLAGSETVN